LSHNTSLTSVKFGCTIKYRKEVQCDPIFIDVRFSSPCSSLGRGWVSKAWRKRAKPPCAGDEVKILEFGHNFVLHVRASVASGSARGRSRWILCRPVTLPYEMWEGRGDSLRAALVGDGDNLRPIV